LLFKTQPNTPKNYFYHRERREKEKTHRETQRKKYIFVLTKSQTQNPKILPQIYTDEYELKKVFYCSKKGRIEEKPVYIGKNQWQYLRNIVTGRRFLI